MKKLLIIPLLFICSIAYADIDSVSGIFSDDNTVVISGSGFGSKTSAQPILFDTFEDGLVSSALTNSDNWTAYQSIGGLYDNQQSYSGSLSAYNYVNSDGSGYSDFNTSYTSYTETDEVFLSYKMYCSGTGSKYGVGKACRITSSVGAGGDGVYNGTGDTIWSNINYNNEPPAGYVGYNNGLEAISLGYEDAVENQWMQIEMYKKVSTAGIDDGIIMFNNLGISDVMSESAVTRASGETFLQDSMILGLMYANIETGAPASMKMWIDDVYIDNTRARVVLGDNPVYSSCTKRDMQPATAWSDGSVSITFNQGSFTTGETAYFFVVDSDGTASSGYAIVIGSGTITSSITGTASLSGGASIQ